MLKVEKSGGVVGEGGCGDIVVWLRNPKHIQFTIAVLLTFRVFHGTVPSYRCPPVCVADLSSLGGARSINTNRP